MTSPRRDVCWMASPPCDPKRGQREVFEARAAAVKDPVVEKLISFAPREGDAAFQAAGEETIDAR